MIYLDNAATTNVKPQRVMSAVTNALRFYSANPGRSGHKASLAAQEQIYLCRKKCAEMFGAKDEAAVIFTANCTMSLNTVIKGVLKAGDHVVVSSLEHNSVMRPLEHLRRSGLIEYDVAEVVFGDAAATYRAFERQIKDNTKMIICTHASNVTGQIMPIEQIGALCNAKNILFCVDAAQTAGVLDIDMQKMHIDYLCVAPHKGLYAPMGTGLLIANKEINKTLIEGGTGSDSANMLQQPITPEGFESGTVNLPGICGVAAGVDFVNTVTHKAIRQKEMKIAALIYERLYSLKKIITYTSYPQISEYVPVIPFNIEGIASEDAARYLDKNGVAVRAGLHCAPSAHKRLGTLDMGALRVSPSFFNSLHDADVLYKILRAV